MYAIMGGGTVAKLILFFYCQALRKVSDSMAALAEDHMNDVLSNVVALVTAGIANKWTSVWWLDPVSGILISLFILWRWSHLTSEQVLGLLGYDLGITRSKD